MNKNSTPNSFTVLIPDGENILSLLVVQCLAQVKNIDTVVLSSSKRTSLRFSRQISSFQYFDEISLNGECRLQAINNLLSTIKIDVILPVGDTIIRLMTKYKDSFSGRVKLGLLPSTAIFDVANDKWSFYQWLEENKFSTPHTVLFNGNNDFKDSLVKLQFPVLAKPTKLTGGKGIARFENAFLLKEFLLKESVCQTYVVQNYIKGHDLGFNILAFEGKILAHTIQKPMISSFKDFEPSYGLEFFDDVAIYKDFEVIISKLNWTGVANFDLRYDEETNEVKIIEMNTRFWGNLLGSLKAGVNFPYLSCLVSLGYDLPKSEYKSTSCITGKAAYKYWMDRCFRIKKKFPKFENTSIKFVLRDPGPYCFILFKRILG